MTVNEVLIGTKVQQGFVSYEDNEDVVINNQKYWIQYKVKYRNNILESFQRFYPEGPITYSIEELKNDTTIYKSVNIPINQNWTIKNNVLFENNFDTNINLVKLDKKHYKEKDGNRIFIVE